MRLHLNTAWHSFLEIIASHEAGERGRGLLSAAHVANWLVSCHLLFLQIGKLSFSAGASELLSLLSRLHPVIGLFDRGVFCTLSISLCTFVPLHTVNVRPAGCPDIKKQIKNKMKRAIKYLQDKYLTLK